MFVSSESISSPSREIGSKEKIAKCVEGDREESRVMHGHSRSRIVGVTGK